MSWRTVVISHRFESLVNLKRIQTPWICLMHNYEFESFVNLEKGFKQKGNRTIMIFRLRVLLI